MTSNTGPKPAPKYRPTVFVYGGNEDLATGFLRILSAAEPDDLAAIDAAVDELLQFRDLLAASLARRGKLPPGPAAGLKLVRPAPDTAPGKDRPPPRSGASGPHTRERGSENRARIVAALTGLRAGPLTVAEFTATGSGKKNGPRRYAALPEPTPEPAG